MGLAPVAADADVDLQRDGETETDSGLFHLGLGKMCGFVQVRFRSFEDQFVVDLENHFCARQLDFQAAADSDHRHFDKVRGGPLNGIVDRHAFAEASLRCVMAA